jgi:hypothetical protein
VAAIDLRSATGETGRPMGYGGVCHEACHQVCFDYRVARRSSASCLTGVVVLIGSVLAVATSGIAVTASAAVNSRGHDDGRTIYLHSTFVSATVNSAGNGGAGDVVANLRDFATRDGQTGHADISCTTFPNDENLCHAAFVFPKGQIEVQVGVRAALPSWPRSSGAPASTMAQEAKP